MSIKVKGYIQVTFNNDRCMVALDQIESVSELNGVCEINLKYQPITCKLDQSFDEVCALIKEAQE